MTRTPLIAGNWKMFKMGSEAVNTVRKLAELTIGTNNRDIMIAPPFLAIPLVYQELNNLNNAFKKENKTESRISIGAQNLYHENQGAYTGEVSAPMIKDAGATHVIIGHSERRQYFGETDESICKKIGAAFESDLTPVMCIGETESEKNEEKTFYVLDKQIRNGLKGFRSDELSSLVIAYEPVWAIGTGKTATSDQVEDIHKKIRSLLKEMFGVEFSESLRILYGGSVKPDNIADLMSKQNIDGALVGGASLDAETFAKIVNF
ncbi:Triosephosphate isomerase [Desulfamplus magnetovallimortis]|uniref:Triosephosphate isomerase n=1 Tax=Desulfamplus magnetovallimortis TaxID=1246637 RepID=A0A1W1H4K9_9BACT|nr:triose-phosphate isomerase [Desulfamplus magnetovallimortis]SLM27423.1 Triosephosphate isomerase [Desulfamplus magnetovallimortis]